MTLHLFKLLGVVAASVATAASAQHHSHGHASSAAQPPASAYAGEQTREIKALSAQEQRAWLEGQGAGLARAAELNSYPGPMHVLEHAQQLGLSGAQRDQTQQLLERHKAEVRALGAELVAAERRLDELFRMRQATPQAVTAQSQQIAGLQARIRASHLNAHVEQTALLSGAQVAAYDRLRGYR